MKTIHAAASGFTSLDDNVPEPALQGGCLHKFASTVRVVAANDCSYRKNREPCAHFVIRLAFKHM